MRIVVRVEVVKDGEIVFEIAESTSAKDTPFGQTREETDIGPRIIQLKYPRPDVPIAKQSPLKKRLMDDEFTEDIAERAYVIGRYRVIKQLWCHN